MGQYWTIFNLDKNQAVSLGKIQEYFFTSSPTELMHSIFVIKDDESWSGDRILCLGDNSNANNFPKHVFSEQEWAKFNFDERKPRSLFNQLSDRSGHIGFDYRIKVDYSEYVLRNLSKKEYVRGDNLPEPYDGEEVTMGHAFLSMIGCSYPGSAPYCMNIEGFHNFDEGKWAGDRFDVVRYDDVQELLESGGWKDVSDYMKKYLEIVFEEGS